MKASDKMEIEAKRDQEKEEEMKEKGERRIKKRRSHERIVKGGTRK